MNKKQELICGIACWVAIFCICAFLFGCSKQAPIESAFNDAQQSFLYAKDSLPAECQTQEILEKFDIVEMKYEKAQIVCETQVKDVQTKYERSLLALFIIISIFFIRFFIKK